MKKLIVVLCLCVFAVCSYAQKPAAIDNSAASSQVPTEDRATKEDVLALLDVMHARRSAEAGMEMMMESMKGGSRAGFLKEYPNASPGVLKKLDAIMDGALKVVNLDEVLAGMTPIYQKYLSHEDAISLISFYSSPAGQRYLERMPALLKEVGEMSTKVTLTHIDEIQASEAKGMEDFRKYIAAHPDEVGARAMKKASN